jgi:hypothetical protein
MDMSYASYVQGTSFRFFKPGENPLRFYELARRLRLKAPTLEILNTRLPTRGRMMRKRLQELCGIPRMSTFAIGAMINEGISRMPEEHCLVNVGVWCGFTFLAGLAGNPEKRAVGVDNFSEYGAPREQFLSSFNKYRSPNHCFFEMDYVDYFRNIHDGPIGFYIYDGSHDYDSQLKGLQVAEPFFAKNCIVLVDDTNWPAPRQSTLDFISSSKHEYRVLLDENTLTNCHPTLWNGIMIFQRVD